MLTKKQVKYLASKYLIRINGCGPGDWRGPLVPDKAWWLWGAKLTPACNTHDLLYGLGGQEDDRKAADKQFRSDIKTCLERHAFVRWFGWRPSVRARVALTVALYYRAVKHGGKDHFEYHDCDTWQDIICEEGFEL